MARHEKLADIRFFSNRHRAHFEALIGGLTAFYGERLSSLAIFGSYARGEAGLHSDLDLLIVLRSAGPMGSRIREFIAGVEEPHEGVAQRLFEEEGILMDPSPYILTKDEALRFQPIYFDWVDTCILLEDRDGLVERVIAGVDQMRKSTRAEKVEAGAGWAWIADRFLGGEIL